MPRKVHKLEVSQSPFALIAISCPEERHKLAWMLNNAIGLALKDSEPIIAGDKLEFPTQRDDGSNPEQYFLLAKNRHLGRILMKELQNIDYILKVEGFFTQGNLKELIKQLKTLDGVVAAIMLDPSKLKRVSVLVNA